jgi:hypothetical protein
MGPIGAIWTCETFAASSHRKDFRQLELKLSRILTIATSTSTSRSWRVRRWNWEYTGSKVPKELQAE